MGDYVFRGCTALESIIVESGNVAYHSKDNCLIETATNTLILGCKNSKIPNYVTRISDDAFDNCYGLTSINIPASVVSIGSIGDNAFDNCYNLQSITVESGNTIYHSKDNCLIETATNELILGCKNSKIPNYVKNIVSYAFYGCSKLESIEIPASVTTIGFYSFYKCTNLKTVTFGADSKLYNIGGYAFEGCISLESIEIPDNVSLIVRQAFKDCNILKTVTFGVGSKLKHIGSEAFFGCTSLENINIPASVTNIDSGAFNGCSSLESITVESGNTVYHSKDNCLIETATNTLKFGCKNSKIPNYVTSIGYEAFNGCSSLESIELPANVTNIAKWAFSGCSSLKSITMPSSVISIGGKYLGEGAFNSCSSLTTIVYQGTIEQWNAISKGSYWDYGTGKYTIHCTDGSMQKL